MRTFLAWWSSSTTARDRILGIVIGGFGFFWIGLLLLAIAHPFESIGIGEWLLGSVCAGAILGLLFPKSVAVVCFPFTTFGGGS